MAFVLGKDAKAYRNSGTFGSPTWVEVSNMTDLKNSNAGAKALGRRRASGIFNQYAIVGIDMSISWGMFWDLADVSFTTMRTAFYAGTEIDMIFLDGSQVSGSHQGIRMSSAFAKFEDDESLADFKKVGVEACPGMAFVPLLFTGAP